ncbi:hypothetical protein LCGC14_0124320 [marine sediment metagenome]|uniref:VCBS repeat-containing protein n=1 Tax=marine sediment metagenome TaxID=412755 RepID=A0A0F9VL96_9ZZZZ|nr:VCBS repeat-containing protein [Phycisphaerae bacterium]HDZ42332.1 VCBS repeat-containing protein [Phycisphaerae bacterium]
MPLHFRKQFISEERFESAGVFDVDGDGHLDIVSGGYWYPGPDFRQRCPIGEVMAAGDYYDDFSTIPLDVTGDGRPDFITGGFFGAALQWRENPKGQRDQAWELHEIDKCGNIETTRAWDIDGDGQIEIIPNLPGGPLLAFKLAGGEFKRYVLWEGEQGHGLGCGDIAGNGRMDIVLRHGWLECPERPLEEPWTLHEEFDLGSASVPILVADVNGDGLNDLIVGQAHEYGLHWWRQQREGDKRTWTRHAIDPFNSQYHDMQWIDIDGDGQCELVTGKRYRAHCGNDPGADDPVGIYYFKWTGEGFSKQVIDYGAAGSATGCGIHFAIADLTGDGRLDIVAPGKGGLWVFFNEGER